MANHVKVMEESDSGCCFARVGDVEGEAEWEMTGRRKHSRIDVLSGPSPWVPGLLEYVHYRVMLPLTDDNRAAAETVNAHDRHAPIKFVLGDEEHASMYLVGCSLDDDAGCAKFELSNTWS